METEVASIQSIRRAEALAWLNRPPLEGATKWSDTGLILARHSSPFGRFPEFCEGVIRQDEGDCAA